MIGRRRFLVNSAQAAGAFALAPAFFQRDGARPSIEWGTACGDIADRWAIVWSRTDRPARMHVEWATTESFTDAGRVLGPLATPATGFTGRIDLLDLPLGQRIFYRVRWEDLNDSDNFSEISEGTFLSGPDKPRDVMFAWSADVCGQGWGINPDRGGMRIYDAISSMQPDFFVHLGDTIYADQPIAREVALPDGSTWKNLVTPAKSKAAETLDEFRGNHLYNMLDANVRRFNATVPQYSMWDDHEVRNNWYPQQRLDDDPRYTEKSVAVLSARARQAFLEHVPIRLGPGKPPRIYRARHYGPMLDLFALDLRTYRGPNSPNRQAARGRDTALAGSLQMAYIKSALLHSKATWKVIASDLPLGLVVRDGQTNFEAFANGDPGAPLGREHEIAELLRFIHQRRIKNVVVLTADVHYAAAHYYDPARASFKPFSPFWEFVAGPLNAGTGTPVPLDATFGPETRFLSVPPTLSGLPGPAAGYQFFGTVKISAETKAMTVRLHNLTGQTIYSVDLAAQ